MNKKPTGNSQVVITGGRYGGITIDTPGGGTHPMGMRERLALFNMLQNYLPGAKLMDAYAGSGALGIEALSRGAKYAIFVDKSELALQTIERNLYNAGVQPSKAYTLKLNVRGIGEKLDERYDIIFADPPYDKYEPEMVTDLTPLVADGGLLVVSAPVEGGEIPEFAIITQRKYARCHITVYQKI